MKLSLKVNYDKKIFYIILNGQNVILALQYYFIVLSHCYKNLFTFVILIKLIMAMVIKIKLVIHILL